MTLKLPNVKTIAAGALGNGTLLSKVTIGTAIESLANSLFTEYDDSQNKPATFRLVMLKLTPPEISEDTFANLRFSGSGTYKNALKIVLSSDALRNTYMLDWRDTAPFSSMTNEELTSVFIYE